MAWISPLSIHAQETLRPPLPQNDLCESDIEVILEQERWLARLSLESQQQISCTKAEINASNAIGRLVVDFVDILKKSSSSVIESLPIEKIAGDKSLINHAKVSYDSAKQIWKAVWFKPRLFHFGMLLRPAIDHEVKSGQSFAFQSGGISMIVSRDSEDHLTVSHEGDQHDSLELGARQLKSLLEQKVEVDDYTLFLDPRGNLILEARGKSALQLSQIKS